MTMRLRDELVATAKKMSALGLTPGVSGNVSVRSPQGMLITPSGLPYGDMLPDDVVEVKHDGSVRAGQRTPSTEWQLHRDILGARQDVQAIVHTHSLFCTSISTLRRSIPAIHYMVVLAGSDEIPCAEYATFGSAELALNAVSALRGGSACLLANHGMVALGATLAAALRLAAEVETLAGQYWHAAQIGEPHVLDSAELQRVRARFAEYGQHRPKTRRS
ncbi:MAG TPA: class II aldolase/adducin family protein [Kofleriaceae bacterium]|nr:class II aldolase/adducin family protein [Kofleriaceae bacterium]